MKLFLYNTLTRSKEEFVPIDADLVKIYSCGPTVYAEPHIGNFRAFMLADLLRSVVEVVWGYRVKHVMNITDVGHLTDDGDHGEDKMEKWAKRENKTVWELARMYEKNFLEYLWKLNIKSFDVNPRATEHMKQQIDMVHTLTQKWYTYEISGDGIYIDTNKVEDYGKLAKLDIEWMSADYRVEWAMIDTSWKRNPTDFSIWKFSPVNTQRQMERVFSGSNAGALIISEVSPTEWTLDTIKRSDLSDAEIARKGFPWRHIECSAMAIEHLWEHIDIHTWWVDHIPVHHTNEITQSECCLWTQKRVNYWLHQQFLNIDGGKMSKSKGDDLSVPGVLAKWIDPLDLRYFYFTWHYRSFLDFSRENLESAKRTRANTIKKLATNLINSSDTTLDDLKNWLLRFKPRDFYAKLSKTIADDLDTVQTLATINTALKTWLCWDMVDILLFDRDVLKLGLIDWVIDVFTLQEVEIPEEITLLAQQRLEAKQSKNYATADALRDQIIQAGRTVKDTTDWFEIAPN